MGRGFVRIFKTKYFKPLLCLCFFIFSAVIIAALMIGKEAGNFVIQVENKITKGIGITIEDYEANPNCELGEYLKGPGVENMGCSTLSDITYTGYQDMKQQTMKLGKSDNENIYIYTFYIVNTSPNSAVDVNVSLSLDSYSGGMEKAIRFLTVYHKDEVGCIYRMIDDQEVTYENYHYNYITETVFSEQELQANKVIGTEKLHLGSTDDASRRYTKYSLIVWLEGQDPDCNAELAARGGTIQFSLNLEVIG